MDETKSPEELDKLRRAMRLEIDKQRLKKGWSYYEIGIALRKKLSWTIPMKHMADILHGVEDMSLVEAIALDKVFGCEDRPVSKCYIAIYGSPF